MKRKKMKILTVLIAIAVGASCRIGAPRAYADNIYVTKAGSPDPDGSSDKPYHVVESAIARAKSLPGSTVLIEGGKKYYETFTADTPCTLKSTGGTVTIGKMDYQASTTLDIITLNTHLYGDQFTGLADLTWNDKARAYDIAIKLKDMGLDKPDVVAFQEIWDEDLFFGGDGVTLGILRRSEYFNGVYGGARKGPGAPNSGLALMSKRPLEDFLQVSWLYSAGEDALANKGWVQATIQKGGFHILLFNLHTQNLLAPIRYLQIEQLALVIYAWRRTHPDHVIFAMGDFNVYGHDTEYLDVLISFLGSEALKGRDADRNSPGFVIGSEDQYTFSQSNPLPRCFDDESDDGRLDYIFYFPSLDGSVEVLPTYVDVLKFRGRNLTDVCYEPNPDYILTTNESSDHWSVYGKFKLIRTK